MLRLAVSSVISQMSVAICDEDVCIGEIALKKDAIDNLLDIIDTLLVNTGKSLDDIDEFVIVNGPGSYAGIRVGLSVLKTMALVKNKKVTPINTVELMAYEFRVYKGLIVVAMESRKDEFNFGMYGGNPFNKIIECETIRKELLFKKLNAIDGDFILVGDLKEVPSEFAAKYFSVSPKAGTACILAMTKESMPLEKVSPIYAYPVNVSVSKKKEILATNK